MSRCKCISCNPCNYYNSLDMHNNNNIFDTFNDKINIVDLYLELGGREPKKLNNGEWQAQAFWRADKKASFTMNEIKNLGFDHGGGDKKEFNLYHLALEVLKDKNQAMSLLRRMAGVKENITYVKPINKTTAELPTEINIDLDLNLNSSIFTELSEENKKKIKELRNIEYNTLNSEQKKIIKQNSKSEVCLIYWLNDKIKFYQRWLPENKDKYQSGSGASPKNCYQLGCLNTITQNTDLWIVEGIFDALSMQLSGFNCLSKYNGDSNNNLVAQWLKNNHKNFNKIYLALDDDKAGIDGTKKIIETLGEEGKNINLWTAKIPRKNKEDKNDPNNIFRTRAVKEADFITKQVPKITGFEPYNFTVANMTQDTADLKSITTNLSFENNGKLKPLEFYNGTVNAIPARIGSGKTTLQLNLQTDFVITQSKKVLFITLEETEKRLSFKMLALACYKLGLKLPVNECFNNMGYYLKQELIKLNTGQIRGLETQILEAMELLKKNVTLVNIKNDIANIERVLNQLHEDGQSYDVIFIDYFQRIRAENAKGNSWETAQEVGNKLLDLAIKLDTVLILGSQKNRTGKDDADTSTISGGDGLAEVCNTMLDIQRESGTNRSKLTVIKSRDGQFLAGTSATYEVNDNVIKKLGEQTAIPEQINKFKPLK